MEAELVRDGDLSKGLLPSRSFHESRNHSQWNFKGRSILTRLSKVAKVSFHPSVGLNSQGCRVCRTLKELEWQNIRRSPRPQLLRRSQVGSYLDCLAHTP